uniref:uncharacterized protein LOC122597011 n=1 Tax=Erigeron canadensis TaxID=72917 RepID=UPI001CB8E001|nr:uncharacterized protein LOC122597011 [Erigeron canadensis]
MSPYLFTIVLEVLTLILQQSTQIDSSFRFHHNCVKQCLVNLCFANDLFLFARGDVHSARILMDSLSTFKCMSGVVPSIKKSTIFFSNVSEQTKQGILNIMPFDEDSFIKIAKSLWKKWKKGFWIGGINPSFAGRLQLIRSVLSSMHVYWASIFILPSRIVNDLEKTMRGFLWCQGPMQQGKAKVAWKDICVPKYEGGLSIRRISDMNKALMASHDVPIRSASSWGWRKLLHLRPTTRQYIWSNIGDGKDTSALFFLWSDIGPIGEFVTPRDITTGRFNLKSKVADIISNGSWSWPLSWYDKYMVLRTLPVVPLNLAKKDELVWRDNHKKEFQFSTTVVWDAIRTREDEVNWVGAVWSGRWVISRSAYSVMGRLVVVATAYFLWQERNNRMFMNHTRPPDVVSDLIISTVHSRLSLLKFKRNARVVQALTAWGIVGDQVYKEGD